MSAPQVDYSLIEIEIGVGIRLVKLAPENRLVIMTLLQAIAEQDERNVITNTCGAQRARFCARVAAEAKEFCGSAEFMRLCALVRFNPERRHYPMLAARALDGLRSSKSMKQWHSKKGHNVNTPEEQDALHFQTVSCS